METLEHEDAMEFAVQLTCSYLGSSHSSSTDAAELIAHYYREIRRAETMVMGEFDATREEDEEEEREAA